MLIGAKEKMKSKMLKKAGYAIVFALSGVWACDRTEPPVPERGRTVLIYMAADNSLDHYAVTNLKHIAEGMKGVGGRVLIYADRRYDVPRLLKIRGGEKPLLDTVKTYAEENSASPVTLHRVLEEMRALCPSESYGLILWSHGMGWLPENYSFPTGQMRRREWDFGIPTKWFGQDVHRGEDSGREYMEIDRLAESLEGHFDFILFDACFMSSVEVLYELRDKADYFIVSPAEIIAEGFPYDRIMPYLYGGADDLKRVCREYFDYYAHTLSSLYGANSATVALVKAEELDTLAETMRGIVGENDGVAAAEVWRYPLSTSSLPDVFYDLGDYVKTVGTDEQRARFQEQLKKTVVDKRATSEFFGKPVPDDKFSGLSVYIPQSRWQSMNEVYSHLSWYQTVYRH